MLPTSSPAFRSALLGAALLAGTGAASAADGPLHLLYFGQPTLTKREFYSLLPGQGLAPEAIYFDCRSDAAALTPTALKHFDAVFLAVEESALTAEQKGALEAFRKSGHSVKPFPKDADDAALKAAVLEAAGPAARKSWEAFVAAREPRRYEKRPDVANYEKRPEPLQYQFPMSPKGSMAHTQVPADFDLQLFASEPDIFKPIAMAWDERGRLWLAETRDYPNEVRPDGQGNDDIKICEDTNGDGKADKFTVFADKLNIPTSLTFANGGVIVSQAPHFLFLKDTDGDGKADVREVLFKDSWGVNDTHAGPSNLHWGYDNWLYGSVGYAGFHGTPGSNKKDFGQGVYRFRADGSAIEFLHQFTNNTWGFGYNNAGDIFGSTANNAPSFFGGIPQTIVPAGTRIMTAKRINTVDKLHPNTTNLRQVDSMGGWTAAAGHMFMNSDALPERLRGQALVTEPTCKLISAFNVVRDGAGYKSEDAFNLLASSDEWMSPVSAEIGPDGAVWVADWQNFIIQHNPTPSPDRGGYKATTGRGAAHVNPNRDAIHGRIYRVVWKDGKPTPIKSLAGAPVAELVKALGSENQFWRLTAQRLLVEGKKTDAAEALKALVKGNAGGLAPVHALWSLQGMGALDTATHQAALLAKDPALRRNAVRALDSSDASRQLYFGSGVVQDPDLTTRLAAFVKLAQFPSSKEIQTVVGQLQRDPANGKDEWLNEAVKLLGKVHKLANFKEGQNLLTNAGFEKAGADGQPEGWTLKTVGTPKNVFEGDAHAGTRMASFAVVRPETMDVTLGQEVAVKPKTDYRLTGWVRTDIPRGTVRVGLAEMKAGTDLVTKRSPGWTQVEGFFNSGDFSKVTVQALVEGQAIGTAAFDDLTLTEVTFESEAKLLSGDPKRGEEIFLHHPTALCVQCHAIGGKGGNVGPALDGVATRKDAAYITQSLLEPNAKLADGFAGQVSPMPPMGLILKDQELEDIKAYLLTLKAK